MEKQSFISTQERQAGQEKLYTNQEQSLYSNQEPSLYAEVGEAAFGGGRHNLSSFGGSYRSGMMSEPAPYATTTLAMNSKMRTLVWPYPAIICCHIRTASSGDIDPPIKRIPLHCPYFHCQIPQFHQVC